MLLRTELWVTLWVTAGLSILYPIVTILRPPPSLELQSIEDENGVLGTSTYIQPVTEIDDASSLEPPPLSPSRKRLFRLAEAPPVAEISAAPPAVLMPVLRGILDEGQARRAVLTDANGSAYVTVAVGGTAFGYTIEEISADGATLAAPDGTETELMLRGEGESP